MSRQYTILVVDDDPDVTRFLERYLELEGFDVDAASNWQTTRAYFKRKEPDLVVLDLGLPGVGGLEIATRLREVSDTGIIILTGSDDKVDKIVSLESGADDFVQKPFDERELLARIRSVLRRRADDRGTGDHAKFNGWTLDKIACELRDSNNKLVHLTQGEYQLLVLFLDHAHDILTRDEISEQLYSRDWMPTDRSIDVMVNKLRKKLDVQGGVIKTVRGKGYLLACDVAYD